MTLSAIVLLGHVLMGAVALVCGAAALLVRKGSHRHVQVGRVFVATMSVVLVSATLLAALGAHWATMSGIVFMLYCVVTGWQSAAQRGRAGSFERVAILVPLMCAAFDLALWVSVWGVKAIGPDSASAPTLVFLATLALLAAFGNYRYLRRGYLDRPRMLTRHLWRMCFPLAGASGSFFMGQPQVFPDVFRESGLPYALTLAPVLVMAFWLMKLNMPRLRRLWTQDVPSVG